MGRLKTLAKDLKTKAMTWVKLPDNWICEWVGTASNISGIEVEQFDLRNGIYRHRTFDDNLCTTKWIPGPHPIAERLRKEGKTETDGFRPKIRFR